ncbi:MAG: hypothetical protein IPM77_15275 [Crocinitomicaceae bacterium]|nr:hypothetical protein [Crocinitomicaceae bacterium]
MASKVVIKDMLDSNLEWQTLAPLAFSHPVNIDVSENGEVTFTFDNIMLPDSSSNEPESHGFITYRIDLISGLAAGTSIYNTAKIYFDANPDVVTNTAINTIYSCNSVLQNLSLQTEVCEGTSLTGEILDSPSNVQFEWNLIGLETQTGSSLDFVTDTSGVFDLDVTASANSCSADTSFVITTYPEPFPQIMPSINLCSGDSVLIFGVYETNAGNYFTTVQNVNGCDSITSQELIALPFIPTEIIDTTYICAGDSTLIFELTRPLQEFTLIPCKQ